MLQYPTCTFSTQLCSDKKYNENETPSLPSGPIFNMVWYLSRVRVSVFAWLNSQLGLGLWFWTLCTFFKVKMWLAPHVRGMGFDLAFTRYLVVYRIGQLARGINSQYELRLRWYLHSWKALDVWNCIKRLKHFSTKFWPQNGSLRSQTDTRSLWNPNHQRGTCP
jgi:hypothetical protein